MNLSYIIFFSLITLIVVASFTVIFKKKSRKNHINLPEKINFQPEGYRNYGVGSFLLDITTLGGHGRLKVAKYNYENAYYIYVVEFNGSIDLRVNLFSHLNDLGSLTKKITKELEKSKKLLGKKGFFDASCQLKLENTSINIKSLKITTNSVENTGSIILGGTAIGGLAAIGSWTMVSLLGTASTGTAISSLAGIAAHNAILAWFGGGALAVGGGGIAAGTITLGAIFALPVVIFSSYKTHKNANDLENSTNQIIEKTHELVRFNSNLRELINLANSQKAILEDNLKKMNNINNKLHKHIYPYGVISRVKRNINDFLNQEYYNKIEADELDEIILAIDDIYLYYSIMN